MRASSHQGYRLATPPLLSFCRSSIPPPVSVHAVSCFLIGTLPSILRPYLTARPTISPSILLKTAQNRPFCSQIFLTPPSITADRMPAGLLKVISYKYSCKFRPTKKTGAGLDPAPLLILRPRCRPAAPQAPCAGCPESARPAPRRSPAHSRPRSQ